MYRLFFFLVLALSVLGVFRPMTVQAQETSTRRCSFYCVPVDENGQPRGEPIQAQVVEQCDANPDCEAACRDRCRTNGTANIDSEGRPTNGLPLTSGRLGCHIPSVSTASTRPRCVDMAPSGGGTTGQGATQSLGGAGGQGTSATPTTRTAGSPGAIELLNPLGRGVTSIPQLFGRIVRAFMGILGALALFWFVWGGILWMTAEESKRSEQAQTIMKNAALGLILIFFSYGLTSVFLGLFEELATNARPPSRTTTQTR